MKRRIVLTALLLTIAHAATAAARLEIKGVPLGLAVSEYESVFPPPGLKCYGDTCYKQTGSNLFYGGAVVTAAKADLIDGKVESIELAIPEDAFAGVVAALGEKFGRPTDDADHPIQNKIGNTFPNRRIVWRLPDGAIVAEQRSGDTEHSSITLSSAAYLSATAAKAATKPKEDAKGL